MDITWPRKRLGEFFTRNYDWDVLAIMSVPWGSRFLSWMQGLAEGIESGAVDITWPRKRLGRVLHAELRLGCPGCPLGLGIWAQPPGPQHPHG